MVFLAMDLLSCTLPPPLQPHIFTPLPLLVSYYSFIATINLAQVLHSAGLIVGATCPDVGNNEYKDHFFHVIIFLSFFFRSAFIHSDLRTLVFL